MKILSLRNLSIATSFMLVCLSPLHAGVKIVGGERVTDRDEAPYIVSLEEVCGGSIISDKWVLTAAHCAGYFENVKGGMLNLEEHGETYSVKRVIKHPKYNKKTMSNDFCLVELNETIDFKKTGLKPIQLADAKFEEEGNQGAGVDATVYGFGDLDNGIPNESADLNKVVVPIVSHEEANREASYDGEVDETMLPAGYAHGGKDSCQGDSGGPLVVFNAQNVPVQVGVVSWGEGCANKNKYGIYSKVSSAYQWIMSKIK